MTVEPDSPEFHRLATRWLDGVASAAEAERLFAVIHASPACAAAFAQIARFEHLLEITYQETRRETAYLGAAQTASRRQEFRSRVNLGLKVAAGLALCGWLGWQLWPEETAGPLENLAVVEPKVAPVKPKPRTVVMRHHESAHMVRRAERPFIVRLDDFFLTSLDINDQPLGAVIEDMKRQARELNLDRDALFDRLSISLPTEAAQRRVSLRCGAISFLKAMRTLASLAHCDVSIEAKHIALSARALPTRKDEEAQSPDRLLANSRGVPQSLGIERLAEMMVDAAGLGMQQKLNARGQTELIGTAAQFAALDELTQARDQIRVMPPLPLRVYVRQNNSPGGDRVLDKQEAGRVRLELSGQPSAPVMLRPSSDDAPLQKVVEQSQQSQAPPSIVLSSRPAGDGYVALTFTGGPTEALPNNNSSTSPSRLTDAVLTPGQALVTDLRPILAQSQTGPTTLTGDGLSTIGGAMIEGASLRVTGDPNRGFVLTGNAAATSLSAPNTLTIGTDQAAGLVILPQPTE
jgi:hypothetical protein